ncbi:MAG: carbohydrate ABC transporter permease [Anaerolineae bacterium]|nr:carbohydrate ABC transporter permease [Anaerolineae bacterium]
MSSQGQLKLATAPTTAAQSARRKWQMGKRGGELLGDIVAYTILIIGAVIMVGPFLWMLSTALKQPGDQFTRSLIPDPITFENFQKLTEVLPFTTMLWNSIKIALITTVGQILTCAMGAFVFAVVRFRYRNVIFFLLLTTLMIPSQATLIPNFILFKWLGLYGTQTPLWLPAFWGGAFGTFLLRQYFMKIPLDLAESARVDGASLLAIFWRIYLPLARPAIAALTIFVFLGSWNNLLTALIYLPSDPQQTTLTVGLALLQAYQAQSGAPWTLMMAGAVASVAPILLVFIFAQRQFIEGIALSGMK